MAPRRSNRLQNQPDQSDQPSAVEEDVPVQVERSSKRKIPVGGIAGNTGIPNGPKRHKTIVVRTAPVSLADELGIRGRDKLSSLPLNIFGIIADNITDRATMNALSQTSRGFYILMAPRLYKRIAVAAMFHAHIAKLIRTLEPHLTVKQKKQLKTEGKYKGQQEKYPTGLDEKKVPICAGYVRQLVIGHSDPGKKHKYIVERYCEEAMKNMDNLNVVETSVVTKSISESIASLHSLKALCIHAYNAASSDVAPLAHVKDLKHLIFQVGHENLATGQSIMRNSMSTLQSLDITTNFATNSGYRHYFSKWEKNLKSSGHDIASRVDGGSDFPALRTLHIGNMEIDEEYTKEFPKAISFCKLRELTFANFKDSQNLLWPLLTRLIMSYNRSGISLDLRTLTMDMDESQWWNDSGSQKAEFTAKCLFLASFDTLTTLKLPNYGQYRDLEGSRNPGLVDPLLQAILKHKNLKILRLSYIGKTSGLEIPYLGADSVGDIIDNLPNLREFEFAPDESQIDAISQALCRGRNLESVTCFPHASWCDWPRPDPLGTNILSSVLSTFMTSAKVNDDNQRFVWEDHYKLNRLNLGHTQWDIASGFGKREKGQKKPEKFQIDVRGKAREVWYWLVPSNMHVHVGYDPLFEWVTKVEKELN